MIEIIFFGFMSAPYIDNANTGVVELLLAWIAPNNGHAMHRNHQATCEKIIFVGTTWVGNYKANRHK